MATKTYLLAEREYIAILGLASSLTEIKFNQSAGFDAKEYVLELIEAIAIQRLDGPAAPPVEPTP